MSIHLFRDNDRLESDGTAHGCRAVRSDKCPPLVIPPPPSDEASGPDAPGGNSSAPPPADDVVDDDDTDTGGEAPGLRRKEARRLWESPSQAALRGAASESDDGDAASIADDAVGLVLGSEEGWEVITSEVRDG